VSKTLAQPDAALPRRQDGRQASTLESALERFDAVTVLTVMVILLVGVPSYLTFRAFGAAGTPANLVGILGFLWWANARLVPSVEVGRGFQPIRLGLAAFAVSLLASYAAAFTNATLLGVESRAADRGILKLIAWSGIALLAADGIASRERLDQLLRRMVLAGVFLSGLGILQFATGFDVSPWIHIPGLSAEASFTLISQRAAFRRVGATAVHPIEFGVVLALILPIALHYAFSPTSGRRLYRWTAAAIILVGIPMSLSRSAILGLFGSFLVLFVAWPGFRRLQALIVAPVFAVAMRFAVPGLLGTITSLFTTLTSDTSYQARTDDYAVVTPLIKEQPWLGRGFGTFLPELYRFLDNQYLMSVVETGFIGLGLLLLLLLVGIGTARGARRRSADPVTRDLAQSLAASVMAALVSFVTFDALSFPMVSALTFLILGCVGALWRFSLQEETARAGQDR
jgi:polysaccharide biosynthesis protein PslJ